MTAQEVFDKVVAHLRQQGKKSKAATLDQCAYRGVGGLKCAVGCLIGDDEYSSHMEGTLTHLYRLVAHEMSERYQALHQRLFGHYDLLYQLQQIHDMYDVEQWETQFQLVAKDCDLIMPPKG